MKYLMKSMGRELARQGLISKMSSCPSATCLVRVCEVGAIKQGANSSFGLPELVLQAKAAREK